MWDTVQRSLHDHPVGYGIWAICCLFALVVGRAPARVGALTLLSNEALSIIWKPNELFTVFWHLLLEDTAVLLVLAVLLQLNASRWLLWATAVQTASVVAHLPRLIDPSVRPLGYAWMEAALGYLLVGVLVIGAYSEARQNVPR